MHRVGKIVPPKRQILKDISLSFFPGAKIGILGLNGSGKSTILRIMAGVDTEIDGEAMPMPNLTIGYLEQEPKLDPDKTVRETVEEALGEAARPRASGSTRSTRRTASPTPTSTRSPPSRRSSKRSLFAAGRRRPRAAARDRRRRAAPAAVGREDRPALGRREAPRRAVPAAALQTRHAAARRTDEPSRRRERRVARTVPAALSRAPSSRSPTIATSSTTPPSGFSNSIAAAAFRGRATTARWLDQKQERLGAGRSDRIGAPEGAQERTRVGALRHARAARRRARAASRASRNSRATNTRSRNETQEIFIPVAERLGDQVIEFKGVRKAYGDRLLMDDVNFTIPAGAIVGIIGPNGAGKIDAVPHDRRQGTARCRRDRDRADGQARGRRSEPRIARRRRRPCSTTSAAASTC